MSDCCRVALLNGKPAGFIGCLIPKWKHPPPLVVLGPVGVCPEFRRRGIAFFLVMKTLDLLRKQGHRYSLVGTPETNVNGVRLYKKAGYKPVFHQINLEKEL